MDKGRIVVIEDESIVAMDIKSRLESMGYTVPAVFDTGAEAVERVPELSPDLILVDIVIKGAMDGIDTAERIMGRIPVPIVYLTAYGDGNTLERAKMTGPFGYILKPFESRELYSTIETALYRFRIERRLKEAQHVLIQAEKLAAVGRLASGIAHEVKNPLGIILGGIEFLELKLAQAADDDTSTTMRMMKDAVMRADNVIQSLLKFSRPTQELKRERVDLNDLVKNCLGLLRYKVNVTRIQMVTELSPEPQEVEVERSQIEQVILNILFNAVEAMPKGGELKVKTCLDPAMEQCVAEITDSGEGIKEEHRKKLFEPFFTTKRERKGTGLGLYISKMIIDNHQGALIFSCPPTGGTKVSIMLNVVKKRGGENEKSAADRR